MSDVLTGVSNIDAASLADISAIVQSYLFQESILIPTVTDYSKYAVKGSKSVDLPRSGGFTINSKEENTSVSAQALTYVADTILFNKHRVAQWVNEKIADKQAIINLVSDQLVKAGANMGEDVDNFIIEQLLLASTATPDHQLKYTDTSTDVIVLADILAQRKLLIDQKVKVKQCFLGVGSEKEAEMLAIDNFIDASKYGANVPIMEGEIGKIYGVRTIVHVGFGTNTIMWHPSAVGIAFQQELEFDSQKDLKELGTRYSLDYLAGFKVLDDGVRNVVLSET